jgi:hypothetical protein
LPSDFYDQQFFGTLKTKGYDVIKETALRCACKARESDTRTTCKNCGGSGWIFVNPTRTRMIIIGMSNDKKYNPEGRYDLGAAKITADEKDKLSFMDRITVSNATTDHTEVLYPTLTDDTSTLFVYTKYNIKSITFLGLFEGDNVKLKKLEEITDYTFENNIIKFNSSYNSLISPSVSIRYTHAPQYHVIDIDRDSMRSKINNGNEEIILPTHAMGVRAHLVKDAENYNGDRLLDNSWLPNACTVLDIDSFERQIKYTSSQTIFDYLTDLQKSEISVLLAES